jgi:hypothetical protein
LKEEQHKGKDGSSYNTDKHQAQKKGKTQAAENLKT